MGSVSPERVTGRIEALKKAGCQQPITVGVFRLDGRYETVRTSCRKCANCKTARRNALVGRMLAEQRSSPWSATVTLTYGENNLYDLQQSIYRVVELDDTEEDVERRKMHARWEHYRDVQLYMKRLRHVMPNKRLRYFAVGERGGSKGRVHWHIAIFGDGEPAGVQYQKAYLHYDDGGNRVWRDGFSYWDEMNTASAAYVAKYLTKSDDESGLRVAGWSARPALGKTWFDECWARLHAEQGLCPSEARYHFDDVYWTKGERAGQHRHFYLRSAEIRRGALAAYVSAWNELYGSLKAMPYSDLMNEFFEDRRGVIDAEGFLEDFYMRRFDKPGRWSPLLRDGGRGLKAQYERDRARLALEREYAVEEAVAAAYRAHVDVAGARELSEALLRNGGLPEWYERRARGGVRGWVRALQGVSPRARAA